MSLHDRIDALLRESEVQQREKLRLLDELARAVEALPEDDK